MRRTLILSTLLVAAGSAHAASNADFTVVGTITGSSCQVESSGNMVTLPSQNRSSLSSSGAVAGKTAFRITVRGCSADITAYFQKDQITISPEGRLKNTVSSSEGGAENVELQLLNSESQVIDLSAGKGLQNSSTVQPGLTQGTSVFDFFVQYFATGVATGGKVKSSVTFLIENI